MKRIKLYLLQHIFLTCIVGILFSVVKVASANPDSIAAKAFTAYKDGKYAEAIQLYDSIVKLGYISAELYYNLGNAHFKNKDVPSAILYYERALRLKPNDEDIDFNLKVANQNIIDKTESLPELFFIKWYKAIINFASVDGWAVASIICFFLAFTSLFFYFFTRNRTTKIVTFYSAVTTFILFIFFIFFAHSQYKNLKDDTQGIIFTPTVTVKSSPDEKGTDLFILHEGTKVQVTDKIGDWCEIRIANGSKGWLKASDFVII